MSTPTNDPDLLDVHGHAPAAVGLTASAAAAATEFEDGRFGQTVTGPAVRARGYWEGVWRRFRRDRMAIVGAITIVVIFIGAFAGAPIAESLLGHGPNEPFTYGTDANNLPVGPLTQVETNEANGEYTWFILGADSTVGRDLFLRLLYGAQVSLQVAMFTTIVVVLLGVFVGAAAGYFRGGVDTVVSRMTEIAMAFPFLLFAIALSVTAGERLNTITLGGTLKPGVVTLIVVLSIFGWFYPARIMRGIVLSLREKEFIEAAHMTGASDGRIIRSHVLPHLVAPITVYSTLIVASLISAEAGLSFLGVGIPLPTASWGNLLAEAPNYYSTQPWLMVWPGLAVMITVLAFNLLGDGLRDAFDPKSSR